MTPGFSGIVATREDAHRAAQLAYVHAKVLIEDGKRVRISCAIDADPVTVKQHRFFHGPVCKQISEQVALDGVRYARPIWKKHLKNVLLPDEFEMQRPLVVDKVTGKLRPAKKAYPVKKDKSLADLDIRAMSDFIDRAIAYAVTEWGVEFRFLIDEREAVRWHEPVRKTKAAKEAATA